MADIAKEISSSEYAIDGNLSRFTWMPPVETHFFVGQDTTAMEMPRAWTETALERRISLALLTGSLLQAIAAATGPLHDLEG